MAEMVHMGRTRQRAAGPAAELGDTEQVAWCTEEPVEAPDITTRLINLATCSRCIDIWNDSAPAYAQVSLVKEVDDEALDEALDEGMRGM